MGAGKARTERKGRGDEARPAAAPEPDRPFAGLAPEGVLDALDAVGLRGDGRLIQLNSYENRVFQVYLESGDVVVAKFYRPGRWSDEQILEEHGFAAELAAAEIPVVAPLVLQAAGVRPVELAGDPTTLAHALGQRYGVAPRCLGRAPELEDPAALEWLGRFLGRIHAVGARGRFAHRGRLDLASHGLAARDYLLEHDWVAPDALPRWRSAVDTALDAIRSAFDALAELRLLRLHGDCHLGNILWADTGPHFVDLDDAITGPAIQDLWMLLSGDRASMTRQIGAVLAGYKDFMDFDRRELRLIEPLRTLRMIHHSAWIARRWNDPAFPIAFPWFDGAAYWQQQATQIAEQVEAMREPPLATPLG